VSPLQPLVDRPANAAAPSRDGRASTGHYAAGGRDARTGWRAILSVVGAPAALVAALAGGLPSGAAIAVAAVALSVTTAVAGPDRRRALTSSALTVLLVAPLLTSAFDLSQIGVLAIGALGLVVLSGFTGQISVAQGAFVGVGAYVTAVLGSRNDMPLIATLPVDVVAGALIGLVVGVPSARLRGIYQVMTTLAVSVAFPPIIVQIGNLVGGSSGLVVPPLDASSPKLGAGPTLDPTLQDYLLCLACGLVVWVVLSRVVRSHHGTAMRAIRQNEVVAAVNGVAVARYRVSAFVLSSAIASLAGGLSAITIGAVSPESFGLLYSIEFLVIIAVGGAEGLGGALVGAIAIFLVTTDVQGLQIPHTTYVVSDEVIYGAAVIAVLLLFRGGLWGAGMRALRWSESKAVEAVQRRGQARPASSEDAGDDHC
jgi:branched-chain amino acid transport system permease protein